MAQFMNLISRVEPLVKSVLAGNDASHDWLHIERVRKNALDIAHTLLKDDGPWLLPGIGNGVVDKSNAEMNLTIIELAALLHDVGDFKYTGTDTAARDVARDILDQVHCDKEMAHRILAIVENVSYRKEMGSPEYFTGLLSSNTKESNTMAVELAIVQDADRLDAIGAIGVVRCFSYSAARGQPFYERDCVPKMDMTREEYDKQTITKKGNPVHHFYEKLFHIRDKMKTAAGLKIAHQRHDFMFKFVRQLEQEVGLTSFDLK